MFRLAIAQLTSVPGRFSENLSQIEQAFLEAEKNQAHALLCPELSVTGYLCGDMVTRADFVDAAQRAVDQLVAFSRHKEALLVVGSVRYTPHGLRNALFALHKGDILGVYDKMLLPNTGVFREKRYFSSGNEALCLDIAGVRLGFAICEDLWHPQGPIQACAEQGAELVLGASASPFEVGKQRLREEVFGVRARENRVFLANTASVGSDEHVVFDGASVVFGPRGGLLCRLAAFERTLACVDLDLSEVKKSRLADESHMLPRSLSVISATPISPMPQSASQENLLLLPTRELVHAYPADMEAIYHALLLGIRAYVQRSASPKVLIGLSGGIDSALVASLAVDALGVEAVSGVYLPSEFSSSLSTRMVKKLTQNLGISLDVIPIQKHFRSLARSLTLEKSLSLQNIQARLRGLILMSLSNERNALILCPSNKSEAAVGYATLYGDTVGALAPIKDLTKEKVFALARFLNKQAAQQSHTPPIPPEILTREPSAELHANQKDSDTLPTYPVLDALVQGFIEEGRSVADMVRQGWDPHATSWTFERILANEYKRRQAPFGLKVSACSLDEWLVPLSMQPVPLSDRQSANRQ